MKVPYVPRVRGEWVPANVHRVPYPKTRDKDKLCLPIPITRGQGLD